MKKIFLKRKKYHFANNLDGSEEEVAWKIGRYLFRDGEDTDIKLAPEEFE